MSEEKTRERPPQEKPEPWDSGKHMAPDPSWPIEKRLKWHLTCGHILLLNCSEVTRRKAAAAADREAEQEQRDMAGAIAQLAELADEMAAEAGLIAPASSEPDGMPDMADQIRAEVLYETAGRIRALTVTGRYDGEHQALRNEGKRK